MFTYLMLTFLGVPLSDATTPSSYHWGDYDGDGHADAVVVRPGGGVRLLHNEGDGRFRDVTLEAGLPHSSDAHLARWADYDGDGRLDLLLGSASGESRLLRQSENGTFEDATEAAGLPRAARVSDAQWLDADADGRADLLLSTPEAELLFHNAGGGLFEPMELGLPPRGGPGGAVHGVPTVPAGAEAPERPEEGNPDRPAPSGHAAGGRSPIERPPLPDGRTDGTGGGTSGTAGTNQSLQPAQLICADSIDDAAGGGCLGASSVPTLGSLYPLSSDLFVEAATGRVGIGITTPAGRIHIAGPDDPIDGPILRLSNPLNPVEAGRVRLCESTSQFLGGYLHYNGQVNELRLGVHDVNTTDPLNDVDAIRIARSTANVGIGAAPSTTDRLFVSVGGTAGSAVEALTTNSSPAIRAQSDSTSGSAASFHSPNSLAGTTTVTMTQTGLGRVLSLNQFNASSTTGAFQVQADGSGTGALIDHSGTGIGLCVEVSNSAPVIAEFGNPGDTEMRLNSNGNLELDGTLSSPAADYAEWLPRADPAESFQPGDVVAVKGGRISKSLEGAREFMVVSTRPAVLGNAPEAGAEPHRGHEMVAFLGQVPVRVRGRVAVGDFVLASGRGDGTAVALSAAEMSSTWLPFVVGTAWQSKPDAGVGLVNVSIGTDQAAAAGAVIARLEAEVARLRSLESRLGALEEAARRTR